MSTTASVRGSAAFRDRNSIPVLVVRLGRASDFLIALAVLTIVVIGAAVTAFLMFG